MRSRSLSASSSWLGGVDRAILSRMGAEFSSLESLFHDRAWPSGGYRTLSCAARAVREGKAREARNRNLTKDMVLRATSVSLRRGSEG